MILFTKEIATPDRIFAAIKQFSISPVQRLHNDFNSNSVIQQQWNFSDYDQLLLFWISEAVSAFNKRVKQQQLQSQVSILFFMNLYLIVNKFKLCLYCVYSM